MSILRAAVICLFSLTAHVKAGEFRIIDTREFPELGMFAAANQVLGQLSLYETQSSQKISGLRINFSQYGLYYDPAYGANWWEYYFEPITIGKKRGAQIKHLSKQEYFEAFKQRRKLSRTEAAELIKKYIHVRPHILEKVDCFIANHFQHPYTIGVHYRGTDKQKEAPRISYESVIETIFLSLLPDQPYQIFVATDEALFLEVIKEIFPEQVIAIDMERSTDMQGIHFACSHQYEMGERAVMDALLLSKCDLLIRTSSNLSLWSTYFNPTLPVILLNSNYRSQESREIE